MPELLTIEQLSAGYGEAVVLSDVSLSLAEGQALALLGRNGMGKTTLINTIVGVTHYFGGTIALDGADITRLRPDQRAHIGVGWVPQERNIFKSLTVHENLTAVAQPGRGPRTRSTRCFRGSPNGGKISAISSPAASSRCSRSAARWCSIRASCCSTSRSKAWRRSSSRNCWRRCAAIIRDEGMSAILVEQNAKKILGVTDHAIIIERGCVVHAADSATLAADRAALETHLGVTDTGPRRMGRATGGK